ncbi:MAG: hypothetical protein ABIC04_01020, partial [Nanoarchaeota archaeon]
MIFLSSVVLAVEEEQIRGLSATAHLNFYSVLDHQYHYYSIPVGTNAFDGDTGTVWDGAGTMLPDGSCNYIDITLPVTVDLTKIRVHQCVPSVSVLSGVYTAVDWGSIPYYSEGASFYGWVSYVGWTEIPFSSAIGNIKVIRFDGLYKCCAREIEVYGYQYGLKTDGSTCSNDGNCLSGNCDADLLGIKRCHANANFCVQDYTGKETLNNNYECSDSTNRRYCSNGIWGAAEGCYKDCNGESFSVGCSDGNCMVKLCNGDDCGYTGGASSCVSGVCHTAIDGRPRCHANSLKCVVDSSGAEVAIYSKGPCKEYVSAGVAYSSEAYCTHSNGNPYWRFTSCGNTCGYYKTIYSCSNGYCDGCPTSCSSDNDCDVNAHCDGTCVVDVGNGGSCDEHSDCSSGHCQNGFCCASGDCCSQASNCPVGYASGPVCNNVGTCQGTRVDKTCSSNQCVSTTVADDSACTSGTLSDNCGFYVPVYCSGAVSQSDPGCPGSCTIDSQCDVNAHCDGTCVADMGNGGSCDEHSD